MARATLALSWSMCRIEPPQVASMLFFCWVLCACDLCLPWVTSFSPVEEKGFQNMKAMNMKEKHLFQQQRTSIIYIYMYYIYNALNFTHYKNNNIECFHFEARYAE